MAIFVGGVRDGTTWRENIIGTWVRDGSTWRVVDEAWVRDGSTWRQFIWPNVPSSAPTGVVGVMDGSDIVVTWNNIKAYSTRVELHYISPGNFMASTFVGPDADEAIFSSYWPDDWYVRARFEGTSAGPWSAYVPVAL